MTQITAVACVQSLVRELLLVAGAARKKSADKDVEKLDNPFTAGVHAKWYS